MTPIAIAWDIDGTLLDSEPLHYQALLTACEQWDVDMSDITLDTFCGIHIVDVWTALQPRMPASLTPQEWRRSIHDHYIAKRHTLQQIEGAVRCIRQLKAMGVRQVCVSNSSRSAVDANLETLGVLDCIEFSISLDDVSAGKPSPEPYTLACQRLGLPPERVMAIEDSFTGATSARAAGLCVALYDPLAGKAFQADLYLEKLGELMERFRAAEKTAGL